MTLTGKRAGPNAAFKIVASGGGDAVLRIESHFWQICRNDSKTCAHVFTQFDWVHGEGQFIDFVRNQCDVKYFAVVG